MTKKIPSRVDPPKPTFPLLVDVDNVSPAVEIGRSGLRRFSMFVMDDYLQEMQSSQRRAQIYTEIADNDAICGALIFAIRMLCRSVDWYVIPASQEENDVLAKEFLESVMNDMETPWIDIINEILSFLIYGWALEEVVYKQRLGMEQDNPALRSKYSDGRIGWRKISIRAQTTLFGWIFDESNTGNEVIAMRQLSPPDFKLLDVPIERCLLFRTDTTRNNPEGRALDSKTLIPTTDGWKYICDLDLSDKVFDENGIARHVVAKKSWVNRPCYKLYFSNGTEIIADANHQWLTRTTEDANDKLRTTEEIYRTAPQNHSINLSGRMRYRRADGWNANGWKIVLSSDDKNKSIDIISIAPVANRNTTCIETDAPSHMFLAGRGLIPSHNSILRNVVRAWRFRSNIEIIEGIGIERDLAGLPVVTVPARIITGKDEESQAAYQSYVSLATNIRRDSQEGIVLPSDVYENTAVPQYGLKLLSTGGSRQFQTDDVIKRYNTQILATVLADFIMLGHDTQGSRSLASTKVDIFTTAIEAFLDVIAEVFNRQAIPKLFALNPDFDILEYPRLSHENVAGTDLEALGTYLKALKIAGVPISITDDMIKHLYSVAGLPDPTVSANQIKRDQLIEALLLSGKPIPDELPVPSKDTTDPAVHDLDAPPAASSRNKLKPHKRPGGRSTGRE